MEKNAKLQDVPGLSSDGDANANGEWMLTPKVYTVPMTAKSSRRLAKTHGVSKYVFEFVVVIAYMGS